MSNSSEENITNSIAEVQNIDPNINSSKGKLNQNTKEPNVQYSQEITKNEIQKKDIQPIEISSYLSPSIKTMANNHQEAIKNDLYQNYIPSNLNNLHKIETPYNNFTNSCGNMTNLNQNINRNIHGLNNIQQNFAYEIDMINNMQEHNFTGVKNNLEFLPVMTEYKNISSINPMRDIAMYPMYHLPDNIAHLNIRNSPTVNTNATILDANLPYHHDLDKMENYAENGSQDGDNLVLNYISSKILYGMAFQKSENVRLAIGTLERSTSNKIEILDFQNDKMKLMCSENQEFPITKLMWGPGNNFTNTLASSSDIIRLFKYDEETNKLNLTHSLNNKKSKYSSPLTSFDWNSKNPSILGTASIDTTCTIWDLNKNTIRTQLIAHDKEVFDIAFSQNEHVFISTGADGSIRLFDLRSLDHSTIMYETKDPISKIAFNTENSQLISAIAWNKDTVNIIDSRNALVSLVDLKAHTSGVTGMAWAPQSGTHICSVGEDKYVLIWSIENQIENINNGPILSYKAPEEISNVNWCTDHPEWIGITFKNQLQLLRV